MQHSPSFNLIDFGGNHLNAASSDSTQAFNDLLQHAKDEMKPVLIPAGVYHIKSPINVDFRAVIRGEGKAITKIVFDFDTPENAMTFYDSRLDPGVEESGAGGESNISGITFQYKKMNTADHGGAHGLVFKHGMNDLTISDCEFLGFTGYGIYFDVELAPDDVPEGVNVVIDDDENVYLKKKVTYGGNLVMRDLSFKKVGGAIGQNLTANIGRWWFNICRLDNIRLDNYSGHAINKISPQKYIYDFNGFRSLTIDNILAQGSIKDGAHNSIRATFRFGGGISLAHDTPSYFGPTKIDIRNLWEEFKPQEATANSPESKPPEYLFETNQGSNISIDGFNRLRESQFNGDSYRVTLSNFRGRNISLTDKIFTDGNVVIEINNLISDGLKAIALNEKSEADIRINNIVYFAGKIKNQQILSEPGKGVNINIGQHSVLSEQYGIINEDRFIKLFLPFGHTHSLADDPTEGRVYVVEEDTTNLPKFPFEINITEELINQYIVLTMRFKMEVGNSTKARFGYYVNTGEQETTRFQYGVETDAYSSSSLGIEGEGPNNPFNKWVNASFIFRPKLIKTYGFTTRNYVASDTEDDDDTNDINLQHVLKISCLKLSVGPAIHHIYNKVDHNNGLTVIGRNLPGFKPEIDTQL